MCKRLIYLVSVVTVLFVAAPAGALLMDWENAVAPASPGFVATNVADGLYDIGTYGGEQTYEFVVKSNPDETNASMCLIGRRDFGDTQAGIKYEQWNNTGTYGATLFGVVDLDFGVANNPGVDTHLVFVSSEAAGTTALYVNGVFQASVDRAIILSGTVGIGYGAQNAETRGSAYFDDFDGVIYGVAIYDAALSDGDIQAHSDAFFRPEPADPGSEGLAAYYAMENDVLDSSGNGNDGTIVGNPTWIPGVQGTALEFHGLGAAGGGGDYINCGNDASLDIAGPISIALWIRPDADDPEGQGTETAPMAKAMSGISPWNWQVRYGWGSPQPYMAFTFNTSPRAWAYVGQNLTQGEWAHIACSHDGATLKCYLNGAETDSTPMGAIATGEAPVLIGSDGWGCDWIGGIDEVAIYDRGLSDGEVRYLAGDRLPPVVLFEEDFEGLPLGPNVDEALVGDAVWTDTPPEGWTIDESGIPGIGDPTTDGVTEWAGWAFANKDWWIQTAGDQDRSLFTLGVGTVAIADPDEWDDADRIADPIADNPYDTWLSTPAIDISGIGAGTIQLVFDSSWRPEFDNNYHQTASITASFDGGDPVEVLLWESDETSPNYKPYATNETVTVDLGNPEGASSVVLTFGLFDAGNDWWWAIDNVKVIAPPSAPAEPDPSLSIYYTFDEVTDIVADQSGKGHDGVVVGDVTAVAEGILAGAAQLANTGYLDLDGANFAAEDIPTTGMTLAAWTNIDGTSGQNAIFNARASDATWLIHPEIRPGNGDYRFTVRKYGGVTIGNINGGTPGYKQPEGTPVPNEWVHVAMTFSRADAQVILYVNGDVVAEDAITEDADMAGDWGLGARVGYNIDDARHFTGLMDEFHMFTRALSQDEIVDLMAGL